ncbi:MAG: caspase family protein [Deltaproteobacteria bacterium]|nr:MAG: caspase family protein [Deltaproteobacteria bacterium]
MKSFWTNFLSSLFALLFLIPANSLFATTRGISVVSKKGQAFYLYKDYHAVVIGTGDYKHWPRLPNAVKDAREVAAKLEDMGFRVKLIEDPDSRKLKSTLTGIARRLGTETNRALLFYFAGHGETTELADGTELGYIIPTDCPLQNLDPNRL